MPPLTFPKSRYTKGLALADELPSVAAQPVTTPTAPNVAPPPAPAPQTQPKPTAAPAVSPASPELLATTEGFIKPPSLPGAGLAAARPATNITSRPANTAVPVSGTSPALTIQQYSPAVEQWRRLVESYFKPEDVDKMLYVIAGESGGDPTIVNRESGATGLVQGLAMHGVDFTNPEASIQWAASRVYGGRGWADWGEGVTYQGKPFGVLGFNPYPGNQAQQIPEAQQQQRPQAQPTITIQGETPERTAIIEAFLNLKDTEGNALFDADERAGFIKAYEDDLDAGLHSGSALQHMVNLMKETLSGSAKAVGPLGREIDWSNPLSLLEAAGGTFELAGEALATLTDPATSRLPGPAARVTRRAIELAPGFAFGPAGGITQRARAGLAAASAVGGTATEEAGIGRTPGELLGPLIGPALTRTGGAVIRNLAGPGREAAQGTTSTLPPAVQKLRQLVIDAKPLPAASEALRSQERSRRVAAGSRILREGGYSDEAYRRALGAQRGDLPRADFEAPGLQLTDADRGVYRDMLARSNLEFYENLTAKSALDKVLNGAFNQLAPHEFALLDRVFGSELTAAIARRQPIDWWEEVAGVLAFPQTTSTAGDASAPFRQGSVLGWSHPQEWLESWQPMVRAGASEPVARQLDDSLRNLDWVTGHTDTARAGFAFNKVGGHLSELSAFAAEADREAGRAFMGRSRVAQFARSNPLVRASERAYGTFLNQLRGRTYAYEAERMWQSGVRDRRQYEALASVINHASGWSEISIGQLQAGRTGINVFFSPRLMLSRFQVALDPIRQPGSLLKPSARQLAAKNLAAAVFGYASSLTLTAAATGARLSWDPADTDFGKLQYGNTRIDMLGGFLPLIRTVARVAIAAGEEAGVGEGEGKYSSGSRFEIDVARELAGFLRNKESPPASLFTDLVLGETAIGEDAPFEGEYIGRRVLESLVPFFGRDVYDAVQDAGPVGVALAAPGFFGGSTLTYPPGITEIREREAQARYGKPFDALLPSQQEQVNASEAVTQAAESRQQSDYAEARDRRLGNFEAEQQRLEQAWQAGQVSRPLPELLSDLKARRFQTLEDLRADYADTFAKLPEREHQGTLDGYYGIEFTNPDGTMDWDRTIPARETYVARLPRAERTWLEDFLGVQFSKKSELEQRFDAYNADRERLGYFEPDADRNALDRANPEIDVATWTYYGGVQGEPGPVLQSAEAVEMALAMNMPNRDVRLDGYARPINQSEQSRAAWEYAKPALAWFDAQVARYADTEAQRLYSRPYEQLSAAQKATVESNIRTTVRKNQPELDAILVWLGRYETFQSRAALEFAKALTTKYGATPPKPGFTTRLADTAR